VGRELVGDALDACSLADKAQYISTITRDHRASCCSHGVRPCFKLQALHRSLACMIYTSVTKIAQSPHANTTNQLKANSEGSRGRWGERATHAGEAERPYILTRAEFVS
jgi:hypothetical protein